jgi:hypothetical protein
VVRCEICALLSELADYTSKVVNGFSAPFKLEIFKKRDKSFQRLKCIEANNTLSASESTPLASCIKKFDHKMLDHMKCVFNIACYTV